MRRFGAIVDNFGMWGKSQSPHSGMMIAGKWLLEQEFGLECHFVNGSDMLGDMSH